MLPGLWHPIDFFPQYHGMLDTPITKMVLRQGGYWVTVTDEDIIDWWEEGLQQLELQKVEVEWMYCFPILWSGDGNEVLVQTETGTYSISCGPERISLGVFSFAFNDGDNFPFQETFDLAEERHGLDNFPMGQ